MANNKSVIGINTSVFLLMIGVGLIVALLPQRLMKLSASVADVGLLASAFAIPYVLLQIPIGNLSDRFGFKFFLVCGYLLCGLSGVVYFFAATPQLYFGGRFLQGIAEVPIWALAPALLSIQYSSDKGRFIGLYNASLHCGLTVGGLMSLIIFKIWQGNEPFLLFGVLSILGGLITVLFVDNPNPKSRDMTATVDTSGIGTLVGNCTNLVVYFGIALYGAGYGIFITIIPAFLINAKDVSQTMIGLFFALFYIALSLSQLFAGTWSDRNGRKPAMIIGLMLAALGIATFHKCPYPWFMILLGLAGLGLGIFCVSSMAYLNERVPLSLKGTISGAYYFFWGAGYFLGPLLIGSIGSLINYHIAFLLFSILIILLVFTIKHYVEKES